MAPEAYATATNPRACEWLTYTGGKPTPLNWWQNLESNRVRRKEVNPQPHKLMVQGPKAKSRRACPLPARLCSVANLVSVGARHGVPKDRVSVLF